LPGGSEGPGRLRIPAARLRFVIMSVSTEELVQRNARFAAGGGYAGLSFPTNQTLQVVGCVDSRVDPGDVLGLALGEAVVMRNIGGRITPATLRSLALLRRLGRGQPPGGALVILHHTGCGIRRLADYPDQLAGYFEIPVADLGAKAVSDPYAAVRIDVGIARQALPPSLLVSGLVYDVNTGLVDVVVPPATE
jgi:carbonic anhydrase